MIKDKEADSLFRKELTRAQIESSVHFTYRDGFRLGMGIFVGLIAGSAIVLALVWGFAKLFH